MGATLAGFMREPGGPHVAALSLDGFDTHANQGAAQGQLATRLAKMAPERRTARAAAMNPAPRTPHFSAVSS